MTKDEQLLYGFKSMKPESKTAERKQNYESAPKRYDGPANVVSVIVKRQICNVLKYEEVMNKQILQNLCA